MDVADLTQCTQEEATLLVEPGVSAGTGIGTGAVVGVSGVPAAATGSVKGPTAVDVTNVAWGSLKRRDGGQEILLLNARTGPDDCYILGRAEICDVIVNNKSVSKTHCAIYCEYQDARLKVYMRGVSPHGTYVNHAFVRLVKDQIYELKTGDEIFLLNPMGTATADALKSCSYMFVNIWERMTYHRTIVVAPTSTDLDRKGSGGKSGTSSSSSSSSNSGQGLIENYYVVGDQIGFGMCGQVHTCVQKSTGEYFVSAK
jgi:hypothetical protein